MRFSYATLIVNVADTNTHQPVIVDKYYNVTIVENSPNGFQVTQVKAIDQDTVRNATSLQHWIYVFFITSW